MAVLVVEPSAPVRARLAQRIVEITGASEVRTAGGFEQAVAALDAGGVLAVVLEVHLPDQRGLELLSIVRARVEVGLVVVLTSEAGSYHQRECELRGADYFFDKSHEFARATAIVAEHVIEQRRPRHARHRSSADGGAA